VVERSRINRFTDIAITTGKGTKRQPIVDKIKIEHHETLYKPGKTFPRH